MTQNRQDFLIVDEWLERERDLLAVSGGAQVLGLRSGCRGERGRDDARPSALVQHWRLVVRVDWSEVASEALRADWVRHVEEEEQEQLVEPR